MMTKELTVPVATSQARRHVDKIMPGVMATVQSKLSHDLAADLPLVVTTVTFPAGTALAVKVDLGIALSLQAGFIDLKSADSSIVITRTR